MDTRLKNEIKPSEYLKELKIIRYYLNKFNTNISSTWLSPSISSCIDSLDVEIEFYKNALIRAKEYKEKKQREQMQLKYDCYKKYWDVM